MLYHLAASLYLNQPTSGHHLAGMGWDGKNYHVSYFTLTKGRWKETHLVVPFSSEWDDVKQFAVGPQVVALSGASKEVHPFIVIASTKGDRVFTKKFDGPYNLYGSKFSADGSSLIMLNIKGHKLTGADRFCFYQTQIMDIHTGGVTTLDGWFATTWAHSVLILGSDGKPYVYDYRLHKRHSAGARGNRLLALLKARDLAPIKQPKAIRWSTLPLPSGYSPGNFAYSVSENANWMYEWSNVYLGPPKGEPVHADRKNDFVLDAVYSVKEKIVWTLKRAIDFPMTGFHFVGHHGAFEFASRYTFWMGGKNLRRYDPAIYYVEPWSGKVTATPIPYVLWDQPSSPFIDADFSG